MSSTSVQQCPRFVQNAWKKDLCSNCFKSKEEHAAKEPRVITISAIPLPPAPAKSIIKVSFPSNKKNKKKSVQFPKEVSEVIGYGGEWSSESDGSDEDDAPIKSAEDVVYEDDENLQRLTKTNTEFNMNNGNLLGDAETNIKRSFAALKLGAPQKDPAGKKQTLKISVTPFNGAPGSSTKIDAKSKIIPTEAKENSKNSGGIILKSVIQTDDTFSKPAVVMASSDEGDKSPEFDVKISNEKSLLEEISETLLSKRIVVNETQAEPVMKVESKTDVITVEIKNQNIVTSAVISSSTDSNSNASNTALNNKRTITRGNAITKDMEKPKIQVQFSKMSESSDNNSDLECGATSDYYDVVESRNSYENIPDGLEDKKNNETATNDGTDQKKTETAIGGLVNTKSHFFSNQTVSDMFMAHKPINDAIKKRAESYNLMDNSFVSSKITNDGLIVTKNHLHEDALDSTGSSFDSSSDEEMSHVRSESDSGIGIKANNGSSHVINSSNSSDYEDIQVTEEINKALNPSKSRALAGEPDGRSDPDGSSETSPAPALPSSPPPHADPRPSFLHSTAKFGSAEKPKVPIKPVTVNAVKPFQKRNAEIIMQLQQVINKEKSISTDSLDVLKSPKKTRAPEPPQESEMEILKSFKEEPYGDDGPIRTFKEISHGKNKFAIKTNTVQLKEPRQYPAINPKFRSLNHLNKSHEAQDKLEKLEKFQAKPSTPEPAPRHSLSLSQDSLNADLDKVKKKKFSIKKFLRMGSSTSKTDGGSKKDYSHYADIPSLSPETEGPAVKPRLIIIHPLDINNTGVQVVKDASSASPGVDDKIPFTSNIIGKPPPAPPVRSDTTKLEVNKPSRPPPPKNAELRSEIENHQAQQKTKAPSPPVDNVYANLGEVRNSIAPRKPERTNSMREREAKALELQRRQPVGGDEENSKEVIVEKFKSEEIIIAKAIHTTTSARSSPSPVPATGTDSFNERKKKLLELENSTRSKIELFESNAMKLNYAPSISKSPSPIKHSTYFINSDGLKSSVQKMNVTIDNYLKNKKMSASDTNLLDNASRSPSPQDQQQPITANCAVRDIRNVSSIELRSNGNYEAVGKMQRSSYPEHNIYASPVNSFANLPPRATSMSYCGSEIGESEIYSPYSFCGSEAGLDVAQFDNNDGHQQSSHKRITSRLRTRKGRSVVHTNLEDNYSAVIVANHEALAQVLDQLQQAPTIAAPLRPIANCLNLRFDDFILIDSIGLVVGKRVFHQAIWQNSIYVTLVLTSDSNQLVSSGVSSDLNQMSGGVSASLKPVTEFCDLVPNNYLPSMPTTKVQMVQATITVLPKLQVEALESLGTMMRSKAQNQSLFGSAMAINDDSISITDGEGNIQRGLNKNGLFDDLLCREIGFIMLQLVNGLKSMQAKGIEDMPLSLSNVIMCREMQTDNKDNQARLCILQGINSDLSRDDDEEVGTLCQCALKVVNEILPETKLTQILSHLLVQERADTLSRIKSVLEYVLWGPSDVPINGPLREREVTLQRWLDLARATVLHGLVRSKIELTIYDECHLIFLVRSNSKIMFDASQIIANFNANNNNNNNV